MSRAAKPSLDDQVQSALNWLKTHSTRATREGMARYGIPSDHAYGVPMRDIKALGGTLGRYQPLAVGGKRSRALNAAAVVVARRLAKSKDPTERWVGKDALRELTSPAVSKRLQR